ncbi:MAG: formylglycine-generating enzyme family protein [bacterium]
MRRAFLIFAILITVNICGETHDFVGGDGKRMAWIPGGYFTMGSIEGDPDERPPHTVRVDGFWMDITEVTNAEFSRFVEATGYITEAEKEGFGWVYSKGPRWRRVAGANWRAPLGPGSSIDDKMDHPVVQVSWNDAVAYAEWAGKRLPTEAEWEYAAGGPQHHRWSLGDDFDPELYSFDRTGTEPVTSHPPNGFGLHDMSGSVWEWCDDWYRSDWYSFHDAVNPRGPSEGENRVVRGGAWLNAERRNLRCANRAGDHPSGRDNIIGFRCVASPRT